MKRMFLALMATIVFIASSIPSSFAADTSPPELYNWRLDYDKVNISTSDALVSVRFILSDYSDIELPILLLKSLSSTQMTSFATVTYSHRSGEFLFYSATAIIKFGQSPRVWEWVLYPLKDVLGNSSTSFGPGGTYKTQVTVIDATFTDDILKCEGLVNNWNRQVELFQLLESKYSGEREIAVVRPNFMRPIEVIQAVNCNNKDFRFKYVTGGFDLMGATSELDNIRYYTEIAIRNRIYSENEAKQAAAEDKAAAKVAALKKTTITCVKGKLTKKVTAIKPLCPAGYKKK